MKCFCSIPMIGRENSDIRKHIDCVKQKLEKMFCSDIEFIDTYIKENAPFSGYRAGVWYLGESLKRLAEADIVYFAKGHSLTRGCKMEKEVCQNYGIPYIEED